jgi:dUTP pyrophosphatase
MTQGSGVTLQLKRVGKVEVPLPEYQTPDSAGMDLRAALAEAVHIPVGERRLIPTGLAMAIPRGFEGQVRPRSGLALKHGITVLNTPGTIDADYRGEVSIVLINLGSEPFIVEPLMRIAQLIIAPVTQVATQFVDTLDDTQRGTGGYGSTGA